MQGIGQRERSTVAPQALAMLNSPIIRDWAGKLATRVRPNNETTLAAAVDQAYVTTLSRPPADDERARMLAFIEKQKAARGTTGNAEQLALRDFCHALLCMNEFVYVD